jgi:N-acetylglutamate synthase-like GNAT family acetyltransferase
MDMVVGCAEEIHPPVPGPRAEGPIMEEIIVKVTELNPQLEMEIRDLLAGMGTVSPGFDGCELFARMDRSGRVLGVACAVEGDEFCHLLFVAVRPDSRRQGTGSMLVNHMLSHYAGTYDAMYLVTEDETFFERFGFVRVPRERLPEEIRLRTGRSRPGESDVTAMRIELPGHWTRK